MLSIFKTSAVIDGKKVKVRQGATILEAARQAGIEIPTLCHIEGLRPTGACRVCVVEVEGAKTLAGACHTPVSEGMVVHTHTAKVLAARRTVIELMLAAHTGECVSDPKAENCGLHNLASDQEAGAPRFKVAAPRSHPPEDENRYVARDLSRCIMCRRCVTACRELAGKDVLAIAYRGFVSKIVARYDDELRAEECRDCGLCIEHCPTGALYRPPGCKEKEVTSRPAMSASRRDSGRAALLPLLKEELAAKGCLSREAMEHVAKKAGLSLSEVYAVASFYSFLPREAKAKNRIWVCGCVPCEMKDAESIIKALEEELGIGPGEVTPDGKFAIELAGCIGACDQAPAMLINDQLYGNITPERVNSILKEY